VYKSLLLLEYMAKHGPLVSCSGRFNGRVMYVWAKTAAAAAAAACRYVVQQSGPCCCGCHSRSARAMAWMQCPMIPTAGDLIWRMYSTEEAHVDCQPCACLAQQLLMPAGPCLGPPAGGLTCCCSQPMQYGCFSKRCLAFCERIRPCGYRSGPASIQNHPDTSKVSTSCFLHEPPTCLLPPATFSCPCSPVCCGRAGVVQPAVTPGEAA